MLISGTNLSEAGSYTLTIKSTVSTGTAYANLSITVIGIDCTPLNFKATPSSLTLKQIASQGTIISLTITSSSSKCSSY